MYGDGLIVVALYVGVATTTCVVNLLRSRSRKLVERKAARLAGKVGLELVSDVLPMVVASVRRTWVAEGLGGAIGSIAAALVALALPTAVGGPVVFLIVLAGWFSGTTIGSGVATAVTARPILPSSSRLARPRRVKVADYVSWADRTVSWIAATTGSVLFVLATATLGPSVATGPLLAASVAGLFAGGVAEAVMRAVIRQSQPATTSTVLAWSDALRSIALRQLAGSASYLAYWSVYLAAPAVIPRLIGRLTGQQRQVVIDLGPIAALVLSVAILVVMLVDNGAQRYLRRLWPDVVRARRQALAAVPTE